VAEAQGEFGNPEEEVHQLSEAVIREQVRRQQPKKTHCVVNRRMCELTIAL
jgi:hypothetical protein